MIRQISLLTKLQLLIVYSIYAHPSFTFYIYGIIMIFFVPLLPVTVATIIGAGITALTSYMKHKSIVSGIFFNLKFPKFDWESEVEIVKQGMSTIMIMIFGLIISAIPIGIIMLGGKEVADIVYAILTVALILAAVFLYRIEINIKRKVI